MPNAFNVIMPFLLSALFLVCGLGLARYLNSANRTPPGHQVTAPQPTFSDPGVDPSIPSPELSPEEVVRIQVQALRAYTVDSAQMRICYSLASPSNRFETGPIARFTEMVFTQPYHHLSSAQDWQVGKAVLNDRQATVLVSVASGQGEAFAYRFFLSRQTSAPFENCWMTDSVELLERVGFNQLPEENPQPDSVQPVEVHS